MSTNRVRGWIRDVLPDADRTVMVRCDDDEFPVWPGYHDGGSWRSADGQRLVVPVLGWMDLADAAVALDGTNATEQARAGSASPGSAGSGF